MPFLRIKFETTLKSLKPGVLYPLSSKGETAYIEFLDYSRIDGCPIFKLTGSKEGRLNGVGIEQVHLVKALKDNFSSHDFSKIEERGKIKEDLMNLLFDLHEIDKSRLGDKSYINAIIRDLKMDKIMKKINN